MRTIKTKNSSLRQSLNGNPFRRQKNPNQAFIGLMQDVFLQSSLIPGEFSLYLIGQFAYEGEKQESEIIARINDKDYNYCQGDLTSTMADDLIFIYLAKSAHACKILVVFDPVEIFMDPELVEAIEIEDCDTAMKYTSKKVL